MDGSRNKEKYDNLSEVKSACASLCSKYPANISKPAACSANGEFESHRDATIGFKAARCGSGEHVEMALANARACVKPGTAEEDKTPMRASSESCGGRGGGRVGAGAG